ncbi:MAG TPA: type I restriction endonuclease subunit R [Mesotoga infera]|uniref:Type I restriction enzyme endonuclease subunit n=1 Tax=Mesotoga infera TaxID=1236046 RepID=A0A3D3TLW3_9BACT|nr:type I restriction endonuclease subunit R [Mesotoga infera]
MLDHRIFNERPESQERMIKLLQKLGYEYVPRAVAEEKRGSKSKVIFEDELVKFLGRQIFDYKGEKLHFSSESIGKAIRELDAPITNGLMMTSKVIYDLLCMGKSLEQTLPDGAMQSFDIKYIDFDNPANNIWQVTDEFEVERPNGKFARPDIVLLVNGIPLVVIECKKSSVDVIEGVRQNIRNWHPDYIPHLFKFAQIVIATNSNEFLYGTCGTAEKHFNRWKEEQKDWQEELCKKCSPDGKIVEQDRAAVSLLSRERLLQLTRSFIIYDANIKKIARYKQFFAVKKCMDRIKMKDGKGTKNGVLWHTQGSGKTISMIMLVKMIQRDKDFENPRFILVTDRKNLDKQILENFSNTKMHPTRATTGRGLVSLIKDDGKTVVTTIVNKFETAIKMNFRKENKNIFLIIDEGHRSHYGRLNTYMNVVLPNAVKLAFTGTPLIKEEKKNTYDKFGPLIDSYTMEDAISDGVTVPLVYEGRIIPQGISNAKIDEILKYVTAPLSEEEKEKLKKKYSTFFHLSQTTKRLEMVAVNVFEHFIHYCRPKGFKAILTCSSRASAIDMYHELESLGDLNSAVVISPSDTREGDDDDLSNSSREKINSFFSKIVIPLHGDSETYEEYVRTTFNREDNDIELIIVKDKLLTGFDAPIAAVLYVDKPMRDHNLLQAIARVNRVYPGKDFGLIVDYYGIFKKLHGALDLYSDEKSGMNQFDKDDIKDVLSGPQENSRELLRVRDNLLNLFPSIPIDERRTSVWQECLEKDDLRKEFYERLKEYSKMVDLLFSSYEFFNFVGVEKAEEYRRELLFFTKLRNSVSLIHDDSGEMSTKEYDDKIKNLLNKYVMANDAWTVQEPLDIMYKAKMDEQLKSLADSRSKADAIKTRMIAEISSREHDDPAIYMEFSERIKETIRRYEEERNTEKYLANMEKLAEDLREGRSGKSYPARIDNDSDSKAFYSTVLHELQEHSGLKANEAIEEDIAILSQGIKRAITGNTKIDWRDNVTVHKRIMAELDDLIFDFIEAHGLKVSTDIIDLILDKLLIVAKKRY